MDKVKVVLDTDIGTDIDDSLALSYLLAQERCELLGITTVTGDTQKRAMIADVLCQKAGVEIPIYAGRQDVLLNGRGQPNVPQGDVLERLPHRKCFSTAAIDWLRSTIRQYPGEVTLLAIGPLTNVAVLFSLDPEIPRLLKQTVMMAGHFHGTGPEWNVLVDPLSAAVVYHHLKDNNCSFGLDVTRKCTMTKQEATRSFTGPLLGTVLELATVWFQRRDLITFHDPLAAAGVFEPHLCQYQQGTVTVDLYSRVAEGMTHWSATCDGQHRIATAVDVESFFDHYFAALETF